MMMPPLPHLQFISVFQDVEEYMKLSAEELKINSSFNLSKSYQKVLNNHIIKFYREIYGEKKGLTK